MTTDLNTIELEDYDDIDENHEKSRERQERLESSKKARDKRALIRHKRGRVHEEGYRGNI